MKEAPLEHVRMHSTAHWEFQCNQKVGKLDSFYGYHKCTFFFFLLKPVSERKLNQSLPYNLVLSFLFLDFVKHVDAFTHAWSQDGDHLVSNKQLMHFPILFSWIGLEYAILYGKSLTRYADWFSSWLLGLVAWIQVFRPIPTTFLHSYVSVNHL